MNSPMRYRLAAAIAAASTSLTVFPAPAPAAAAASTGGGEFATPQAAADALDSAWKSGRTGDLLRIFGPGGERLVVSGDPVADRRARERLAASYAVRHLLRPEGGGRVVLVMGAKDWPYPIPIVRRDHAWRFDVRAGADQILDRRIGRDELDAIRTCRAYVTAQRDFATRSQGGGPREYAQKVESSPGARDGLYWPAKAGAEESPLGPRIATAEAKGYGVASREGRSPFEGYYFRILTAQGPHAPGGTKSYLVDGHMTGGFALVAYPARYGDSGVMTFIVNESGIVFQRNLGPHTASVARAITSFDPDRNWRITD